MFEVTFTDLQPQLDRLFDSIGRSVEEASKDMAEVVANEARSNHTFRNRTGTLEPSIHAESSSGSFASGTLTCSVVASAPYASFVDGMRRFRFLLPALRRSRAVLESVYSSALESGARGAF